MKFPVDITHELRAARASRARKILFAKLGLASMVITIGICLALAGAYSSPATTILTFASILWGCWGLGYLTRR